MRNYLIIALVLTAGAANAQEINRQQMREVRAACEADVKRLCDGVQPGGGRLIQCLQQHSEAVSRTCGGKLMEIKAAREAN